MDLDFILTAVVYLAVILYIHYLLRDAEHHQSALKKIEDNESADDLLHNSEDKSSDDHNENHDENQNKKKVTKKVELIIDENEINDILSNDVKNDFMKYLDVEDFDKGSNYQELLKPLQENTIEICENDTTSQLDKFFTNIKDEQYNFNPVPTESPESNDLMADKVLLNSKSDEVFAFDEFDNAFSTF